MPQLSKRKRIAAPLALLGFLAHAGCGGGGADLGLANPPTGGTVSNTAPVVQFANPDLTTIVGQNFTYDVAQNGTTFFDANGDSLEITVTFIPTNLGFAASGSTVIGSPQSAATVTVIATANDGRGGIVADSFLIQVMDQPSSGGGTPTPTPTVGPVPTLPAVSFSYEDALVGLPPYYTNANGPGGGNLPLADTTPAGNPITNAGATLGRVLFYDKRLSANDGVSCASCHQQSTGFSDARVLSLGFNGGATGRHSMGLSNARYYNPGRFFWDERAATLEAQVLQPIQDSVEMGMTLPVLVTKLQGTPFYPPLFQAAFGSPQIDADRISRALAQFVRSMVSYRSKFDQAMGTGSPGNPPDFASVFTAQELQGLNIFGGAGAQGPGACAACHGTPAHIAPGLRNNGLDANTTADQGAGGGRFKSPSLRNVAVRAPFMHDGRFATLREVIDFYDSGVQNHPNLDPPLRAPGGGVRRLNLSEAEKQALEAFMHTLTDTPLLTDPKFSDPFQ